MDNITNFLEKSLIERSYQIADDIFATNQEFKEMNKESRRLEDQLNEQLSDEGWKIFDDYRASLLQEGSLFYKLLYLNGFADGSKLKELFNQPQSP